MKVSVNQLEGNITHIVLDGRLDVAGTQEAETEFNAAVAAANHVIVDLSKVPFICSLGIRLLVTGAQAQSKLGGKLVLMAPDELTLRTLKTTGIDQIVPIVSMIPMSLAGPD